MRAVVRVRHGTLGGDERYYRDRAAKAHERNVSPIEVLNGEIHNLEADSKFLAEGEKTKRQESERNPAFSCVSYLFNLRLTTAFLRLS
jgi:hypothetical protein